jgi:hypothetical protein
MDYLQNPVTIVTAFFDINREEKGDGRKLDEYLEWIKKTLQVNCNLFVVTEEKFREFFLQHRPKQFLNNMHLHIIDFKESYYYKYYDIMKEIIHDPVYKSKIMHPNRIECNLPEYNVIQYSKFHYLQIAIGENPFQSSAFFWMDAGASRFFLDVDISKPFPSQNCINYIESNTKFIIQKRDDLEYFNIDENFIWKSDNLLYGTMFGGNMHIIKTISKLVEHVFVEKMLKNNNVNNEQLALAMVWKDNQELFFLTDPYPNIHLMVFYLLTL